MISVKDILKKMYDAVDGICEATYLQDRPESVPDKLNNFIVVGLTTTLWNREMGGKGEYDYFNGTARFDLYIRDRQSRANPRSMDINTMDEKINQLWNVFPINGTNLLISRPRIAVNLVDRNGFHIAIITARLTTLASDGN